MAWKKDKILQMTDTRIITYSGKTLCDNYRKPLENCENVAQAIRLWKNAISFALLEQFPTKEELLAYTSKETLAENGVYVDTVFNGERIDGHICCVFLNCKGRIETGLNLEKQIVPKFYLSEGSNLIVGVDDFLHFPVDVELYYGSYVEGNKINVIDHNGENRKNNIGFTEEELKTSPDMTNEQL